MFWRPQLTYGDEIKEEKRVLILFPAQSDLPAYPLVQKGIKSSLSNGAEFKIKYFIEFMDYYRNAEETYGQLLRDLYHHKFSKHKIDLIVAYSAPSLSLVIQHANDLFPQTPVVFSGITRQQLKKLELRPSITGVMLDIDYAGLLETSLEIHPQTRHVAIVNGASKTDMFIEKEFRKALAPYAKQLDFIYLTRLPMDRILERVQNLPEHSVVLYYVVTRDGAGKGYPPWEAASIIAEAANAPVYGCLDSYLGHGVVGGRMVSVEMTGFKAGELALRILRGESPADIPMTSQGTIIDLFDWRQLNRFNIREDRLPPGSTVRFKTYSFWELYRWYVVAAVAFLLFQSAFISHLLLKRKKRKRAQEQLAGQLRFETMLSELSARFINLPPNRVIAEIKTVLKSIGKILEADRIAVFEIPKGTQMFRIIESFREIETPPPPSELQFEQLPWVTQKLLKGEIVAISHPDDLPPEAESDKNFVTARGAVSALLIPLINEQKTIGMLSLVILNLLNAVRV